MNFFPLQFVGHGSFILIDHLIAVVLPIFSFPVVILLLKLHVVEAVVEIDTF
jgi:hypothetical protein